MRNEELETRLYLQGKKLWSLKQICQEQQKQLKYQSFDRSAIIQALAVYRTKAQDSVLQCKGHYYGIYEQLQASTSFHQLFKNMQMAKDGVKDADVDRSNLMKEVDAQVELSLLQRRQVESLEEKNRTLATENEHLYERVKKDADNHLRMLQDIFDKVDPKTSKALINPTGEQVYNLIESKIEDFFKQGDNCNDEVKEMEEKHKGEMHGQARLLDELERTLAECKRTVVRLECDNRILAE